MTKNSVIIDTSVSPTKIEFPPDFNVSVPFIDRHLDEGRREKIIIQQKRIITANFLLGVKLFLSLGLITFQMILLKEKII